MRETFDKAWQLVRPPFERVQISWEGKTLDGYFRKPAGPAGKRFPTVIAFQGPDTMCEATILNAGGYAARGMACLAVDFPGQAGSLRLKNLRLPPDTERVANAMIDYLETRPDVNPNRIGMQGISMGGYGVPRAASGEKSD
jgi:dienelactone hydrolase